MRGRWTLLVGPGGGAGRVERDHGAFGKNVGRKPASARGTWRRRHSAGHEPGEPYGHEEADEDDGENDDERAVEDEVGDEAARGDLVNVAGDVLLGETLDGVACGGVGVKGDGSVSTSVRAGGELLTNGEVDDVGSDGRWIGLEVRRHVEHDAVKDEKVGKVGALDVFPSIADLAGLVVHAVLGKSGGREGAEGAIFEEGAVERNAGSVGSVGSGGASTGRRLIGGGAGKERRNVGAGAGGGEAEEGGGLGEMMRLSNVESPTVNAENGAACTDARVGVW